MTTAKLSSKYQIVLPKEARLGLGVRSGDNLLVHIVNGIALLVPKSKKIASLLRGFSKGTYSKNYLKKQRDDW